MLTRPPFPRTTCDCMECVAPCRTTPGYLIRSDIARLVGHLGRSVTEFLTQGRGTYLKWRSGEEMRLPTIIPARKPDGSCVFLTQDSRCAIHTVSPYGCAYFDTHQDAVEGYKRSLWGVQLLRTDVHYRRIWHKLQPYTKGESDHEVQTA